MRRARVLLALPDRAVRESIRKVIDQVVPADVTEAPTAPDAFQLAQEVLPDLVVLAVELPGFDGLQLCHRLRSIAQFQDTPVVVLGPKNDKPRKYQAFYVGATEYVELPFDGVELMYRLKVQLRPILRDRDAVPIIFCGPLVLEPATRTARVDDRSAVLTPSEFSLVRYLASRAGQPATVDQLLTEALGHPAKLGNPQLVHTHIRNLRKKLEEDPANPTLLLRHPAGYMLAVPS